MHGCDIGYSAAIFQSDISSQDVGVKDQQFSLAQFTSHIQYIINKQNDTLSILLLHVLMKGMNLKQNHEAHRIILACCVGVGGFLLNDRKP